MSQKLKLSRKGKVSAFTLMKKMSGSYPDVLQNIEVTLATSYKADKTVDDCAAARVLKATLDRIRPKDEPDAGLFDSLVKMREFRVDVPDDIWRNCIRVVLDSVKTHSTLKPGSRGYFRFVSEYVP